MGLVQGWNTSMVGASWAFLELDMANLLVSWYAKVRFYVQTESVLGQ